MKTLCLFIYVWLSVFQDEDEVDSNTMVKKDSDPGTMIAHDSDTGKCKLVMSLIWNHQKSTPLKHQMFLWVIS